MKENAKPNSNIVQSLNFSRNNVQTSALFFWFFLNNAKIKLMYNKKHACVVEIDS